MPVKFLHTADWQIGMNACHTGAASPRVREARFRAAERLARIAEQEKVDFAILAGDTFENHAVSLNEVERTADILGRIPCRVYVLPGNHDPVEAGSIWERPVWRAYQNIFILERAEPYQYGDTVIFPCPLRSRWSADDPTAWIPAGSYDGSFRIGIAHGTLEGLPAAGRAHPIPADAAWTRRLHYLALGDWHSLRIFGDDQRGFRMAYSGTPEPTRFGEDASGRALIVEIDSPGALPRLREIQVASLVWKQIEREILEPGALARLRQEVETERDMEGIRLWLAEQQGEANYSVLAEREAELEEKRRQLEAAQLRADANKLLHQTLEAVFREAESRILPQLAKRAADLYNEIAAGFAEAIRLEENTWLPAGVEPAGSAAAVSPELLSGGEQEQLHLAVRLALADLLTHNEPFPVILDDVLLATDEARLRRILEIIDGRKQRMQFLILTCHPERFRTLEDVREIPLQPAARAAE
ncbi:MAG: metallophosphoesterase [Bryobacteraceae bacterium]